MRWPTAACRSTTSSTSVGGVSGVSRIIEIDAAATHDLRARVLRSGTSSSAVVFAEDALADTVHLGAELDGNLVAISTWIVRPHPDDHATPGRQVRGMATDPARRGQGHGSRLLLAGLARARDEGADIVWANARTTSLDFYVRHGFHVEGDDFVTADTGLAHRRIALRLT